MYTADDIYSRIKTQPFVPVRIATSDGQSFDVHHPDLVMVGRRFVLVGTANAESPAHADLVTRIAMIHVTALEDVPAASKHGGSGNQ